MKKLIWFIIMIGWFASFGCEAQPKVKGTLVATDTLRGLTSGETSYANGFLHIPYNWSTTGDYRVTINTVDTTLHEWVERIAERISKVNAIYDSLEDHWAAIEANLDSIGVHRDSIDDISLYLHDLEFTTLDSTRIYDSLSVHRDSIDDISITLHSLNFDGDFWPIGETVQLEEGLQVVNIPPADPSGGLIFQVSPPGSVAIGIETHADSTYEFQLSSIFERAGGFTSNSSTIRLDSGKFIYQSPYVQTPMQYEEEDVSAFETNMTEDYQIPHIGKVAGMISDSISGLSGGGVNKDYVAESIDSVDNASEIGYTASTTGDWPSTDPNDVEEALDSLGARTTYLEGEINGGLGLPIGIDTTNIGGWNMETTFTKDVGLGISDMGVPLITQVWIVNDIGGSPQLLNGANSSTASESQIRSGAVGTLNTSGSCSLRMYSIDGGFFADSPLNTWDDDTINRGWIVVYYIKN